jgi:O-antigen/teichoic acid export membrane protein
VIVTAFPAMSTPGERRRALVRSLALVLALGVVCTLGALLLSNVAMIFIGGAEYSDVENRIWLFAILGTLLAMLQLLVYAVLARQGGRSTALFWVALVALTIAATMISTLNELVVTVAVIDGVVLAGLLGYSLWRLSRQQPLAESADPATS